MADEVDDRLDALESTIKTLEGTLADMKKPWYRTRGFQGSALAIALGLVAWGYSFINKDPELPRMFHQHVLMSDQALALIMKRDFSDTESNGDLEKQMTLKMKSQIEHDDTKGFVSTIADQVLRSEPSKEMLFEIAATRASRTYSNARIFQRQPLPLGSVRCQIISDPELWAFLSRPSKLRRTQVSERLASTDPMAPPPDPGHKLSGPCENNQELKAETEVSFVDTSAVVVPYVANAGDRVELEIQVLANTYDETGDALRSQAGHTYVEAVHERPSAAQSQAKVEFDEVTQANLLSASFTAPQGDRAHLIFIHLNEKGMEKLTAEVNETLIVVFATVTVFPNSTLQ